MEIVQKSEALFREYEVIETCGNCRFGVLETWAATVSGSAMHVTQSRCRRCGLVFANPIATDAYVRRYYSSRYYEEHWNEILNPSARSRDSLLNAQKAEVARILRRIKGGRALEIGCGTGALLKLLSDALFSVSGIELSRRAVEYSRNVFGLHDIFEGTLDDVTFDSNLFDLVYAWHVIEHVRSIDSFVSEVHRILKPGGLFWIGTENFANATYRMARAAKVARGLPPPFATSPEHTYAFTPKTLSDVLKRRGFAVTDVETFQPTLREKLATMRFRSPLSRLFFTFQHAANMTARPLMRVVAKRL